MPGQAPGHCTLPRYSPRFCFKSWPLNFGRSINLMYAMRDIWFSIGGLCRALLSGSRHTVHIHMMLWERCSHISIPLSFPLH